MNIHATVLRPAALEGKRRRITAFVSRSYGEFGATIRFGEGKLSTYARECENRSLSLEQYAAVPLPMILSLVPVMRPKQLLEQIGLGSGRCVGVGSCMYHVDIGTEATLRMCERLIDAIYTERGWLLTFDHNILSGDRTIVTATMDWLHADS